MKSPTRLFQGISKKTARRFYGTLFHHLLKSHKRVIIPACGEFTLAKCALAAGYKPTAIHTSDISLFSSVLGYFYSGRPLSDLKFTVSPEWQRAYTSQPDEAERAAFLFWLMVISRKFPAHQKRVRDHCMRNREIYIKRLAETLSGFREIYKGISYEIADMRAVINDDPGEDAVVVLHPPAYHKGYSKQFDFNGILKWGASFQEFDYKKEFLNLYFQSRKQKALYIWSAYRNHKEIDQKEVVFAEQIKKNRYEYFLATNPDALSNCRLLGEIAYRRDVKGIKCPYSLVPGDFQITDKTVPNVRLITEPMAIYYRDLMAHKLGSVRAEQYFAVLLDGKIFGIVGFTMREVNLMRSTDVSEVFGFNVPLKKHPAAHRLFMMLLTCRDMARAIQNITKKNRLFRLTGFKTTCLTKYRKLRSSNGLLKLINREKMEDGRYRLVYHTHFYKRSFRETMLAWLTETSPINRSAT